MKKRKNWIPIIKARLVNQVISRMLNSLLSGVCKPIRSQVKLFCNLSGQVEYRVQIAMHW